MTTVDVELKAAWAAMGIERPPTEDELPCSDGMPMESERHVAQSNLLMLPLKRHWAGRDDVYTAIDMFVYFSPDHVRNQDFRGPDFLAAVGVPKRERKSWVVWQEGRGPDVVIELLSETTAHIDKGEKMIAYQDQLHLPEYYWFDPFSAEFAGFRLEGGAYRPMVAAADGSLTSETLGLRLVRWQGEYEEITADWIRWAAPSGQLLPTDAELATAAREQAGEARQEATEARREATEARREATEAQQAAAEALRRIAELEAELEKFRRDRGDAGT